MSLEDRILKLPCPEKNLCVNERCGGIVRAAALAAEADELMRDMESAIDGLIGMYAHKHCDDAMKSDECHSACEILERYNNWKDRNQ